MIILIYLYFIIIENILEYHFFNHYTIFNLLNTYKLYLFFYFIFIHIIYINQHKFTQIKSISYKFIFLTNSM
jgi:hypothetical protein